MLLKVFPNIHETFQTSIMHHHFHIGGKSVIVRHCCNNLVSKDYFFVLQLDDVYAHVDIRLLLNIEDVAVLGDTHKLRNFQSIEMCITNAFSCVLRLQELVLEHASFIERIAKPEIVSIETSGDMTFTILDKGVFVLLSPSPVTLTEASFDPEKSIISGLADHQALYCLSQSPYREHIKAATSLSQQVLMVDENL